MMLISKITLGTAQLGFNYGIANVNGKPDFNKSIEILNYSWQNEINTFDTSPLYGNSEKLIGSFISSKSIDNLENLIIISKLPRIQLEDKLTFDNLYMHIKNQIFQSIKNLQIKKIPIYLIHHTPDINIKDGLIIDCLTQIKSDGLIDKFGISAYNPEEVKTSLKFKDINVIQIPINIFDQRLIRNGLLKELKKRGYIIFARSIYLQGLFFISPEKLPKNLKIAKEPLLKLQTIIKEYNIDIDKLTFLFVRDLPEISSLVIGTEKVKQVERNIKILKEQPLLNDIRNRIMEEFSEISERIINPSLWNKSNQINK